MLVGLVTRTNSRAATPPPPAAPDCGARHPAGVFARTRVSSSYPAMSVRLISSCVRLRVLLVAACVLAAGLGRAAGPLVADTVMKRHVEKFNTMEPEAR